MLGRFSLYGFLKNQRYFEPFLVLVLLDAGLSFLAIGTLVALREAVIAVVEVPSGALADRFSRRRAMVASFVAYLISFALFATASTFAAFAVAMVLFGFGDAFRTGTHKAMIFSWLKRQGRPDDKTKVYGFTRSWSKLGSATSALIGAGLVLWAGDYSTVFWFAMIPYGLDLLNLATYPAELDRDSDAPPRPVGALLKGAFRDSVRPGPVRHLLLESMGFEGLFTAAKDYLQPVLLAIAVGVTVEGLDATGRTAVLIGLVYFGLYLLAAAASRQAHRFAHPRALWIAAAVAYGALLVGFEPVAVAGFVALYALRNVWRPVLVSRLDDVSDSAAGATLLSVESQARRVATMVLAPTLGWAVDAAGAFWPLGAVGVAIALTGALLTAQPPKENLSK